MARYKVSITVYKDAAGKMLFGPTLLRFLADLLSGLGLMFLLAGILAIFEGGFAPTALLTLGALAAVTFFAFFKLKKFAESKAQAAYIASMIRQAQPAQPEPEAPEVQEQPLPTAQQEQ